VHLVLVLELVTAHVDPVGRHRSPSGRVTAGRGAATVRTARSDGVRQVTAPGPRSSSHPTDDDRARTRQVRPGGRPGA
jgi:hypothetical protein